MNKGTSPFPDIAAALAAFRLLGQVLETVKSHAWPPGFQVVPNAEHHAIACWEIHRGDSLVAALRMSVLGFDPMTADRGPRVELTWGITWNGNLEMENSMPVRHLRDVEKALGQLGKHCL